MVDGVGIGELEAPGVATGDMVLPGDIMLGSDCTVMPSAAEAATAVPRLKESEVCTAAGVAGTAWWQLAGGAGEVRPNCSYVDELLACLTRNTTCELAARLGLPPVPMDSHYALSLIHI